MKLVLGRQTGGLVFVVLLAALMSASLLAAQDKASILKPPKGSKVALVVWEDLECPQCARVHPQINEAAKAYNVPVVVYDFPLNQHPWSMEAAIMARYLGNQDKKLGAEFRTYIFLHQNEITPVNLRSFADRFAAEHKTAFPFVVDPQGKLAAEVKADRDLGTRVGIQHTPTIYVVSENRAKPYVEVSEYSRLFDTIDEMKRQTP